MVRTVAFLVYFTLCAGIASGQVLEFSGLTKLPATVNSNGEESMPLLTPDQKKLFFVRSVYDGNIGGRYGGQDIWYSEKTPAGWSKANNRIENLNNKDNNVLIGINSDGRTFYTLNSSPSEKLEGLYFSRLNNNTWQRPEFIPLDGIENEDFVGMFVSPTYDVIFLTMRGNDSRGEEDLYISLKDASGLWGRPRNLGPSINTSGFEISPFLSEDKKRLYFASNGHGGQGDADIFYCERLYNSWETWSAPVNLGSTVNSKKFDAYFSVYGDSIAFFCSNRDQELSDIYKVNVEVHSGLLASGQTYLTKEQWNTTVGKNVSQDVTFQNKAKELTAGQKELLYFMANKISNAKNIGIHLLVREEEDPELSKARLKEIYGQLRQAGIEGSRIIELQDPSSIKASTKGVIQIMLFNNNIQP